MDCPELLAIITAERDGYDGIATVILRLILCEAWLIHVALALHESRAQSRPQATCQVSPLLKSLSKSPLPRFSMAVSIWPRT